MKKIFLFVTLLLFGFSIYSQSHIMDLIIADKKGKNKKVIEWIDSNPGDYIQISDLVDSMDYNCKLDSVHPLQVAAYYENTTISDYLLGKDDILKDTFLLNKALASTIHNNDITAIKKYLKLGADMSGTCDLCYDRNVLQIAVGNNCDFEIIELCQDNIPKEQYSYIDCVGRRNIHFYANTNDIYLLKNYISQLDSSVTIYAKDTYGATPLMIALWNGHLENAKLLQLNGAAEIIKSNKGYDLIDYANYSEDYPTIKWIEEYYSKNNIPFKEGKSMRYYHLMDQLYDLWEKYAESDTSNTELKKRIDEIEFHLGSCHEIIIRLDDSNFPPNKKEIKNITDYVYYITSLEFLISDPANVKVINKIFDQFYKRANILKYSVKSFEDGVFVDFLDDYAEKLASVNYKGENDYIYFPESKKNNYNLYELKLYGNISTIPDNVINFKSLEHLSFAYTSDEGVTKEFKDKYLDSKTLKEFNIKNVGNSIKNISDLILLESLTINFRNGNQPIMDYSFLKSLKYLIYLDLSFNHFKGFPSFISELEYLETLVIRNTSLSLEELKKIEKMLPSVKVIWQ